MKGVIPTPNIAKNFHPTSNIERHGQHLTFCKLQDRVITPSQHSTLWFSRWHPTLHPTVVMSVLCKGFHSGDYGHHMGIQCNVACASIEIQIICNLFWALEAICHRIIVAAQYCILKKKSGYTVQNTESLGLPKKDISTRSD